MKRQVELIITLIICYLIVSCNNKFYPGEYFRVIDNISYEAFKIRSDSSFEYVYRAGWLKNNSSGKWMLQKNHIVLNSQYKRRALPLKVESSYRENTSGYRFVFKNYLSRTDNPNIWQILIINNQDSFQVKDSVININYNADMENFKLEILTSEYLNDSIGMYSLSTEDYKVESKKDNNFLLSYPFNWNLPYYRDFNNDTLRVVTKALYWPEKNQEYKRK